MSKLKLLNIKATDPKNKYFYGGEFIVTLELTTGFLWKSRRTFQARGRFDEWFYYPSAETMNSDLSNNIDDLIRGLIADIDEKERIEKWERQETERRERWESESE